VIESGSYLAGPGISRREIGGKAWHLRSLAGTKILTPEFEVLGAEAYLEFLQENDLDSLLNDSCLALDSIGIRAVPDLEVELSRRRSEATLPEAVRASLSRALHKRLACGGEVILRSSSNMEDRSDVSMAGVFHSISGIRNLQEAELGLLDIWWRSLKPSVLVCLLSNDLDPRNLRVPVMVQSFVSLDQLAISFSLNPRDNTRSPLVESSSQAGELTAGTMAHEALIDPMRRRQVGDLDRFLQAHFGFYVDLECGWRKDELFVLQVRPQIILPRMRTDACWSRETTQERYPLALTPLGFTNIEKVFGRAIGNFLEFLGKGIEGGTPVACQIDGMILANQNLFEFGKSLHLKVSLRGLFALVCGFIPVLLHRRTVFTDLKSLQELGRRNRGSLGATSRSFSTLFALAYVRRFLDESESRWVGDWSATLEAFRVHVEALETEISSGMDVEALRSLEVELRQQAVEFLAPDLVIYCLKEICFQVLEDLFRLQGEHLERRHLVAALGIMSDNPTVQVAREMQELALSMEEEGYPLRRDAFLARFGHLTHSWDLRDPLLGEDVEALDGLLENLAAGIDRSTSCGPLSAANKSREAPESVAALRARLGDDLVLLDAYDDLVGKLARYMKMDEEHHLYTSRILGPTRKIVRILGDRLVSWGVLPDWDAIHFLKDEEVWTILLSGDRRSRGFLTSQRRRKFETQRLLQEEEDHTPVLARWVGQGASRGVASGRVRKVSSLLQASSFLPGEILVVRTPDPLWTFLYPLASGVVAETGSLLSHGVVSAREYGVPVVLGVADFFRSVKDGVRLKIDGDSGEVEVTREDMR
jgi:pyruvate,water dikinase